MRKATGISPLGNMLNIGKQNKERAKVNSLKDLKISLQKQQALIPSKPAVLHYAA